MTTVGIDSIALYTPSFYMDLAELATVHNCPKDKYYSGIGQERMSVLPPDEDAVTLAANAANITLCGEDLSKIKAVLFATETSVDQSKSAGVFLHQLLNLPDDCRIIEMKQACYSSTFALQTARMMVQANPESKVLVIGSDNARYTLNTPGEATQGCGAVAMLVSSDPRILQLNDQSAVYSSHTMDFWRPNYLNSAIVDGKYSTKIYLSALKECWKRYHSLSGRLHEISYLVFHLPFTRIAEKALKILFSGDKTKLQDSLERAKSSLVYNRLVGNSYTASLYIALCSLLDNTDTDLSYEQIALFSYGSGFTAELFTGTLVQGYKDHLHAEQHRDILQKRKALSYEEYLHFYNYQLPESGEEHTIKSYTKGRFRLAGVNNHKRIYEQSKHYE